jgi:hypothetical protein
MIKAHGYELQGPAPHEEVENVIARGRRVYLRTLMRRDLEFLSEWADDPFLQRMVGSEFLRAFKHATTKIPPSTTPV